MMQTMIAMNGKRRPNRGRAFTRSMEDYDRLIREPWLARMIDEIRGGREDVKGELPFRCAHYGGFRDDHRSQKDALPETFLFQTTVDVDDKDKVAMAMERAMAMDKDETSMWHGMLLNVELSAREKLHIDIRMPIGMTIEETQREYCKALGVPFDESCVTPERIIYIVDVRQVKYRHPDWYAVLSEEERKERWAAFERRGLGKDGREERGTMAMPTTDVAGTVAAESEKGSEPSNVTKHFPPGGEGGGLFKGIAYSSIISRLLLAMGVDGKPDEGERNNYLYSLARELRYITDFNVEKIISVLPDWGLGAHEVRATVMSAVNSVRKKDVPQRLQRIIQAILAEKAQMEDNGEQEELPEELEIPHKLPKFFQTLVKAYPQEYRAAALLASLPCLGALASRVRSNYLDGSTHSPSFITCVVAPQASGKSFARHEFNLLTDPIKKTDLIGREKEREYMEKRKAAKNTKNQPEDPKAVIRLIPATASNAMILKRADYAQGLHLLTFAEEIDTLTKGNKAGAWSQKSDLYRMAFDNAEWGQDYMSDNSYSGQVQLFYNLLICGTPNAMNRFFNDVEDGLVSRVCFIKLPDMLGTKMPQFGGYRKADREYIKGITQTLAMGDGKDEDGMMWMESKRLSLAISSWLEDKRMEFLQTQDNPALDVFRRRAAVVGYRAGMICWAIDGKMTKEGVDFAVWVANYMLYNLLDMFGEAMNNTLLNGELSHVSRGTKVGSLLETLPESFTKQMLIEQANSMGIKTHAEMIVHRWKKAGIVEKVGKNVWKKVLRF